MKANKPAAPTSPAGPTIAAAAGNIAGQKAFFKHYSANNAEAGFQKAAEEILFSKYSPAGIVLTESLEIVHFRGNTDRYFRNDYKRDDRNLLNIAEERLIIELRNLISNVKEKSAPLVKENIHLRINGNRQTISVEVIPLPEANVKHFLVLFREKQKFDNRGIDKKLIARALKDQEHFQIHRLEIELAQTRQDMRTIAENQESVNEELQSANEELLSNSEELQVLNDELEASKDDLLNTNKALGTLNQQLTTLNEEVTAERNYTESIIATIREPLLVLDKNLKVKSANRAFYKKFLVNELHIKGVSIYELGDKQWNTPILHTLLEETLPQKRKFTDYKLIGNFPGIGERIMELNASEIIRDKKEEKLILLSIQDVTEKTHQQNREKEFQKKLEEMVQLRTMELREANEELQQKNQEIAVSKYNKRFITEFSEKFSGKTRGNEFFNSLVQFIADTTRLDYVFVGKPDQNKKGEPVIKMIAFAAFGKLVSNISYPLIGSPCEQVIREKIYTFPERCDEIFSKNQLVQQFNVQGYFGHPLNDAQGITAGLISVMHKKNIDDADTVLQVLKVVSRQAEIELERMKYGEELVIQNREKQKRAEELIITNTELAHQIEEKEKKAIELMIANKELQSFAYISSHDLQEPLRKIQTFASRILHDERAHLSDRGKDYVDRMHVAANRMRALIDDLLAYSKTNHAERKFEKTDLNKIVEEARKDLSELISEKNAVVEIGKLGKAKVNFLQFQQLVSNLLGNALKFSIAGKTPHIKITGKTATSAKLQEENKMLLPGMLAPLQNYYYLSVADNGIGFDLVYKDKIFEVFQRLHSKEDYEGTGIGLAIVKKIVENHGGVITANSQPGSGASFDIYLPAL